MINMSDYTTEELWGLSQPGERVSEVVPSWMSKREPLTSKEAHLLKHLPIGAENAKTHAQLKAETGLNRRDFCELVESLRAKKYPIGAIRNQSGGYFVIVSESERQATIAAYEAQIRRSQAVIRNLKMSSLGV
jgi:hypothetical protein|nr:MAG TPA: hypothetical protein [Caudoviricetes sp.]